MHIKKTFCQRLCKAKICKFKRKLFLNQAKSLQHNKNSLLSKKSKWNSASNRKSCLLLPVFCPDYRGNMVNFGYFPWCFFYSYNRFCFEIFILHIGQNNKCLCAIYLFHEVFEIAMHAFASSPQNAFLLVHSAHILT